MQTTTAVIYARLSEDKHDTGLGVARQETECRARAEALDWTVSDVYVDNNVSATKGRVVRHAYQRLLDDIASGHVKNVIVWDLDRLHRRPIELEHFITLADRHQIGLASVSGKVDLATSDGRTWARVRGAIAASEGEKKAERIRAKNTQAATAGTYLNGQDAFGYERNVLVPEQAALVKAGVEAIIRGESLSSVTAAFNASGMKPRRAAEWSRKAVRDVLQRPRNAAIAVLRGQEVGQAVWEPIVTVDELRAVQSILRDVERRTTPGPTPKLLLSGHMICGKCGAVGLAGGTQQRPGVERRLQYRCPACRGVTIDRGLVDELVITRLCHDLSTNEAGLWTRLGDADSLDEIKQLRARTIQITNDEAEIQAASISLSSKLGMLGELKAERDQIQERVGLLTRRDAITALILDLSPTPKYASAIPEPEPGEPAVTGDWINALDVRQRFDAMPLARRQAVLRALYVVTIRPANGQRTIEAQKQRVQIEAR